jgi:hypothetical protein
MATVTSASRRIGLGIAMIYEEEQTANSAVPGMVLIQWHVRAFKPRSKVEAKGALEVMTTDACASMRSMRSDATNPTRRDAPLNCDIQTPVSANTMENGSAVNCKRPAGLPDLQHHSHCGYGALFGTEEEASISLTGSRIIQEISPS